MTDPPTRQERRFQRRAAQPGRRAEDHEILYDELEKGFAKLTERLSSFIRKALIAFGVLGISCAVALGGFTLVLRAFQHQRYNVFVTSCEDSNKHNRDLLTLNDRQIATLPRSRQKQAKKQSEPFRTIINVAFPYRKDCAAYARSRLKGDRE